MFTSGCGPYNDNLLRRQLSELVLTYAVGVKSSTTVWLSGMQSHRGQKVKHPLSRYLLSRRMPVRRCSRKSDSGKRLLRFLHRASGRFALSVPTTCPNAEECRRRNGCSLNGRKAPTNRRNSGWRRFPMETPSGNWSMSW